MKKQLKLMGISAIVVMLALVFFSCVSATIDQNDRDAQDAQEDHVHVYGEWTVVKDAAKAEAGEKCRVCSCGDKQTEIIPMLTSSGFTYEVTGGYTTCTITGMGTCTDTELIIPAKIDGLAVTAIGYKAFENQKDITRIVLPDTLVTIEGEAFSECSSLTEINLPIKLKDIDGSFCFSGCTSLKTVYCDASYSRYGMDNVFLDSPIETIVFGGTHVPNNICKGRSKLKNVIFKDTVISIGRYAFASCTSLESIELPSSLSQSIGHGAFSRCTALKSIVIPEGVTAVYDYAFEYCESLVEITLPSTLKSFGESVFWATDNIERINIASVDSWLSLSIVNESSLPSSWSAKPCLYVNGEKLTKLVIPDTVETIPNNAFYNCSGITELIIPDSVTHIGINAFHGCEDIVSVTFSESLKSIGTEAFSGCQALTSVIIPDSVIRIERSAFENCSSIESITLPLSITEIKQDAFGKMVNITSIHYKGTKEQWNGITRGVSWMTVPKDSTKPTLYCLDGEFSL